MACRGEISNAGSHYDLPPVLRWLTANIGIHHIHHRSSRIPSYRLGEALRDHPELRAVSRLTLKESVRCRRLALWDEDRRRLVAFRDAPRCVEAGRAAASRFARSSRIGPRFAEAGGPRAGIATRLANAD